MATDCNLKEQLTEVTDAIVETFSTVGSIHHLGHTSLPSLEKVTEIVADLKEALYPGYRRRQNLHHGNVTYYIGDLIDGLHDKLTQQIACALRHEGVTGETVSSDGEVYFEALGQIRAVEFLRQLPQLRRMLADDVQAAYDGDPAARNLDEVILCYPGVEAVTVYRLAHELYQLGVPFIPRMMTEYVHSMTGIDIHPGAHIARRLFIDHGTGVVIGETCQIGENVKLYQGVTLGALSFPKDERGELIRGRKRHPTIENDVVIYANATILGGNTVIGHHAVIGSSVWLTRSVEPHTVVTMERPSLRYRGLMQGEAELNGEEAS